ncbi:MAG: peptidoglycan-binding protein [Rhodospirillaceae bacterium]|nr:peptidoglycan-binding protein [Rhodospirillaceae bacterium]
MGACVHKRGRRRAGRGRGLWLAAGLGSALLAAVPALAGYDEGLAAYQRGDYGGAWLELGPAAEVGDPRAQLLIGQMYAQGVGTSADRVQALKWLNLAAAGGAPQAAAWRDEVARQASAAEQAQAQQLAAEWRPQPAPSGHAGPVDLSPSGQPAGPPQTAAGQTWTPPWSSSQAQPMQPAATPAPVPQSPAAPYEPGPGGLLNPTEVAELQRALAERGYYAGPVDGKAGPVTTAAIRRYQADAGLPVDGLPTAALLDEIRAVPPPAPAAAQAHAGNPAAAGAYGSERTRPLGHVEGATPDLSYAFIEEVQVELMKHGFNPGPVDGLLGWQTRRAIRRYQARAGLPVDGEVTLELLNHMKFAYPPVYAD